MVLAQLVRIGRCVSICEIGTSYGFRPCTRRRRGGKGRVPGRPVDDRPIGVPRNPIPRACRQAEARRFSPTVHGIQTMSTPRTLRKLRCSRTWARSQAASGVYAGKKRTGLPTGSPDGSGRSSHARRRGRSRRALRSGRRQRGRRPSSSTIRAGRTPRRRTADSRRSWRQIRPGTGSIVGDGPGPGSARIARPAAGRPVDRDSCQTLLGFDGAAKPARTGRRDGN